MAKSNNIKLFTHKDIEYLNSKIDELIIEYSNKYGLDINDYNFRVKVKHNTIISLLSYVNSNLFMKPYNIYLSNGQKTLIDFNDYFLIEFLVNKFLDICKLFNKSLGLYSFECFTNIDDDILTAMLYGSNGEKPNPKFKAVIKKIADYKARSLVGLLQDSNIGQMATANNDKATGLNWSENSAPKIEKETVYILPSERMDRLKLENKGGEL